ncbi:TIGR03016 family PEP-CTERM system-associated outer membrane protein [Neptunomonas phycophila]|uniref:TIGR03016 family PEP-CTERM system-associated outer membrane protein n=1 Tax=Neptunomonas phycophila TaxID=1572645 RepID=UPI0035145EEC
MKGFKKQVSQVCVLAAIMPAMVNAANWTLDKGVSVSEVLTDNENLEEDNTDAALITSVTPYLTLKGEGARLKANLNTQLEFTTSDEGHFNPRLGASANAELVEQTVFLDTSANVTQNTVDAFRSSGIDSLNDTNNSNTTYNFQISPHTRSHFANVADLRTRYTFNHQSNSSDDVNSSKSHGLNANLSSGTDFHRFDWNVAASYKDTSSSSDDSSSDLGSLDVTLGYQISPKLRVSVTAGEEWNDYSSSRSSNDGDLWQGSLHWTPTPRTSLDLGYGERYFGSWPTLAFSHRSRHSIFSASYSKELTDSATQLSEVRTYQTVNADGNPVNPITGAPLPVVSELINIQEGLFIDEKLTVAWSLIGVRSSLTFSGSRSRQIYETTRPDEITTNYSVSFSRSLSPVLDFSTSYYLRGQTSNNGLDTDTQSLSFSLMRQVVDGGTLAFSYMYSLRDSDLPSDDYTENRLQFAYTFQF